MKQSSFEVMLIAFFKTRHFRPFLADSSVSRVCWSSGRLHLLVQWPLRGWWSWGCDGGQGPSVEGESWRRACSQRHDSAGVWARAAGEELLCWVWMCASSPVCPNCCFQVSLVALGPLTNLALALRLDPRFPQKLRDLYIMGGNMEGDSTRGSR